MLIDSTSYTARMDWSGPWWLVVLGLGLALLIGVAFYARRSRTSKLGSVAAQLGFRAFSAPPPFSPEERKGFNLFSRGYAGRRSNMFADNPEAPSTLFFDFNYRFGLRFVASVGYHQTVAAFPVCLTNLPDFQLTPATSLDRMAPKLGLQAIRFESRPEFGKKYWLRAVDEIAARALFTDAFLDRLSTADPNAAWHLEKSGGWLIIYQHGKSCAPPALAHFLQASRILADLFLIPR
jgi:hypothetical protein